MNREIHPLTHIKDKKKEKRKLFFLLLITFVNLSIFVYIYKSDIKNLIFYENKENIKNVPQNLAKVNNETNPESKKEITKEKIKDAKINFPDIKFNIDENYFSNILKDEKFPGEISFRPEEKSLNTQEKRKKIEKKDFAYYYRLAKKAELKGDIKSALAFYHKAYKFNPDEDILYKIAYFNYKLKAYYGSIKYLKRLVNKNPNYTDAYILIAKSYERLGNIKKAILILEEAYYNFPNNKNIMRQLAYLYEKSKNPYAAADIYENLAKDGTFKDILKTAKIYERLGNKEKALFYYKKALEKDDGTYKLWIEDKISKLSH